MKIIKALIAGVSLAMTTLASSTVVAEEFILTNGNVLDVESGKFQSNKTLFIKDGKLVAKEQVSSAKVTIVDLNGKWVIPGLSEMHAHIPGQWSSDNDYMNTILKLFVVHGVTNIRGMLGHPTHLALRDKLSSGEVLGPYLVTSGPSMNGNSVTSDDMARAKVKAQKEKGYDFMKIHPGMSESVYAALTEQAKVSQMPFGGHITSSVGVLKSAQWGQTTIDHLDGIITQLAKAPATPPSFFGYDHVDNVKVDDIDGFVGQLMDAGAYAVPTHAFLENMTTADASVEKNPALKWLPKKQVDQWIGARQGLQNNDGFVREQADRFMSMRETIIRAFAKNKRLLSGSDAPQVLSVPGDSILSEINSYVKAGVSPIDAIRSSTLWINQFYDNKHPIGILKEGYRADMVVLNSNPLQNIESLRDIDKVIVRGKVIDKAMIDDIKTQLVKW